MFKKILFLLLCCFSLLKGEMNVLHLTFHRGCEKELNAVAHQLGIHLETWFIPDLPPYFLDGVTSGNALYNVGHDRAERIWNLHQATFETYDAVIVSDTSPLARIFLQNQCSIPLIIWICNRFDYYDLESLDCDFPDKEYYQLFQKALTKENVQIIAYTAFEQYHAKSRGVDIGNLMITPCSPEPFKPITSSKIPSTVNRETTFFLPPYHNEKFFMDLHAHLETLQIPNYCGRYNGPKDLENFKGIIHLPYSWSTLAFFENISLGIPYFIPSRSFFRELANQGNYFHPDLPRLLQHDLFDLSEWYAPGREEVIIYFDSWEDLQNKINSTDFIAQHEKVKKYAEEYKNLMLSRWKKVFKKIKPTHEL